MKDKITGKTRLKVMVVGCLIKRQVLVHQSEVEIDHITNIGGLIDIERITVWYNTKPEWLLTNLENCYE